MMGGYRDDPLILAVKLFVATDLANNTIAPCAVDQENLVYAATRTWASA